MNSTIGQKAAAPVTFSLDGSDASPVYRQIITQIERGVLSGRLRSGDKLPTIRSLAVDLKINPNTIAKAYGELEIRGLLVTQAGCGTFISDQKPPGADEAREAKIGEVVNRFLREMAELGVEWDEITECIEARMMTEDAAPVGN